MNGKGKMAFEVAIEKLMREFFPEKFAKGNIPREKNEEWIAFDDKVKKAAIIQKSLRILFWKTLPGK